jgi:plastin-3
LEDEFRAQDKNRDNKLSENEFEELYTRLKLEKSLNFKKNIKKPEDTYQVEKSANSTSQSHHTVRNSEEIGFTKWINQNLAQDKDLNLGTNPIKIDNKDLYARCGNGLVLCKLINFSAPHTIDERSLNKGKSMMIYHELENLELALRSAEAIGCHVINIRPKDIKDGTEHLILGLLWQIIQIGLFAEIDLIHHPGLALLLGEDESREDLLKLTKEELILRWMNYHLAKSDYSGGKIRNFGNDIKDSVAYTYLLKQIAPANYSPPITVNALHETDPLKRAELMLHEAEKMKVREFITSNDVVQGNQKLNMAFVANLFNTYPALDAPVDIPEGEAEPIIEETREEKTFRNWMNAMGISPHVNYLYSDLTDCLVIFQLYDLIKPGSVDWSRVIKKFVPLRAKFQKLDNCNYAVDIGKNKMKFKLVGIQGSDLQDGHKMFTLALLWQLMRAYILSILDQIAGQGHPIVENGIIEWANNKVNILIIIINKF